MAVITGIWGCRQRFLQQLEWCQAKQQFLPEEGIIDSLR